jgi:hypothetical protein
MKELTIEEKAQRYDEALDCAKSALDCLADDYICNHLTKDGIRGMYAKLFPELVESDDERIKFNVGDWCIDNEDGTIFQIVKVLDNTYAYKTNEGKEYSCTHYSLENDARLWTIQDAKDGDVLADDASVILFRKIGNKKYEDVVDYHCVVDSGKFKIQEKDFYWGKTNDVPLLHPATKEQRDTLMKAMADAGYAFDFENKELKKIEQKSAMDEQNHALNDEDIRRYNSILSSIKYCSEQYPCKKEYDKDINWLKDRVQPQPKQEWKQENTDELTDFENAMMYIGGSFFGQYAGLDPNDTNTIKKQANILLELVPSKEWSEEDKYNFSDIEAMIHTMKGDGRNADKLINWLKERIQQQKQWKPSEEQLKALNTMNVTGCITEVGQGKSLIELYNDLKKL